VPFSGAAAVLATTSSGGGGSNPLGLLVPLLLFGAIGYLLLIRPARNRQRRLLESRSALEVGVEVITTAGLIANVVEIRDEDVTLEIAPGVRSRFLKGAIARVVPPDVPDEPTDDGVDLTKDSDAAPTDPGTPEH
jgi:preprotein translocase subunit YajC